jgi:hypothetical protein
MFRAILSVCLVLAVLSAFSQTESIEYISTPVSVDSVSVVSDLSTNIKDNNRVILSWKVNDSIIPEFFSVERSVNGKDFDIIAIIKISRSVQKFEYTDESPVKGRSIYRIRCAWKEGAQVYSAPVTVQLTGEASFKFYPNPVDNILIIRSDAPLEVQISDASGKTRFVFSKVHGLQTFNVSTLEKGIYLMRVTNRLTNVISQDKLIKN